MPLISGRMQPRERQRRRGELRNYSFVAVRLASVVFPFFTLFFFFAFVSVALGGRVSLPLTLINMPCADLTGTSIATRWLRSLPLSLQCVSKRGNGGTVRKRSLLRLPSPTSTLSHLDHPRPSTLDSPTIVAIIKRNVSLRTSRRVESTSLCFQIILIRRLDIAVKHLRNSFQRFRTDCNSTSSLLTRISCCDQGDRDRGKRIFHRILRTIKS